MKLTAKITKAGHDIASACYDATVSQSFGGEVVYPEENKDLIEAYLRNEIESVDVIYLAMTRAAKEECETLIKALDNPSNT